MTGIIETIKQYEELKHEVESTLTEFCWAVHEVSIMFDDEGYNPYQLGYSESYESHHFMTTDSSISINLSYTDSYDDILDSSSSIIYPVKWLEAYVSDGSLISVVSEVKDKVLAEKTAVLENSFRQLSIRANESGYKLVKLEEEN